MLIQTLVIFLFASRIVESKIFSRCELASALENDVPKTELSVWICLAKQESNLNSKAVSGGGENYGIFQIDRYYWCSDSDTPGKGCNVTCNSLISDDISNSITCAKKIHDKRGFGVWGSYKWYCSEKTDHYLSGCNINV